MLILASSSPRRIKILKDMGIKFKTAKPMIDEDDLIEKNPVRFVKKLSYDKAASIRRKGVIVAADTIVFCHGKIFGKPADMDGAFAMLSKLSGRWHTVFTGIAIIDRISGREITDYEATEVLMRKLSSEEIKKFLQRIKPLDKAGSYTIDGYGAYIIRKVKGCYFNILGLPVAKLIEMMKKLNRGDLINIV